MRDGRGSHPPNNHFPRTFFLIGIFQDFQHQGIKNIGVFFTNFFDAHFRGAQGKRNIYHMVVQFHNFFLIFFVFWQYQENGSGSQRNVLPTFPRGGSWCAVEDIFSQYPFRPFCKMEKYPFIVNHAGQRNCLWLSSLHTWIRMSK